MEAELAELSRSDKEIKLYLKIPMNWLGLSANFPFFSGIQLFGRQRQEDPEFVASFGYIAILKPGAYTWEVVSEKQNTATY